MRRYLSVFRNINFIASIGGGGATMAIEAFWTGLPLVWKGVIVAGVFFLVSEAVRIFGPREQEEQGEKVDPVLDALLNAGDDDALRQHVLVLHKRRQALEEQKHHDRVGMRLLAGMALSFFLLMLLIGFFGRTSP